MKKIWIAVISVSILLAGLIILFFVLKRNTNKELNGDNTILYEIADCFRKTDSEELRKKLSEFGIPIKENEEDSGFGFYEYHVSNMSVSALYSEEANEAIGRYMKIDTNIRKVKGTPKKEDLDLIEDTIQEMVDVCDTILNTDVVDEYHVYSNDGSLLATDKSPYEAILKGEAKFSLFVRETDNSFWKIYGNMISEGSNELEEKKVDNEEKLVFQFTHYSNKEIFRDVTADITLE